MDPNLIANTFNYFFTNVGPNTDKILPVSGTSPISYLKNRIYSIIMVLTTSSAEVMTIILNLGDSNLLAHPVYLSTF